MIDHWRVAPADDALRRHAADPAFDDRSWDVVRTGVHWGSIAELSEAEHVLYRAGVDHPAPAAGDRAWLVLHGVFTTSDVWLDGTYLGDTEGYFVRHQFEVTEQLGRPGPHLLALEVACQPQRDPRRKRALTGVFQHGHAFGAAPNPGGIWRPVEIVRSGPVRIRHSRVLCADATPEQATIFVRTVIDSDEPRDVDLATTVRLGRSEVAAHRFRQTLAAGENQVEWTFAVDDPDLWYPWSRGSQTQYEVEVAVLVDPAGAGSVSDTVAPRLGLRSVTFDDWVFAVNGERMFLKGANAGPTRFALGEATEAEIRGDVALAVDGGLDLLRVHGHVARPELYDAADEAGLLLWQDLPLVGGYHRSVRTQARRQAREAVDLLAHHPSVVAWCGHAGPVGDGITGHLLPTWNKSVLDHSIGKVLRVADRSRPVIPHSGVLPHPPMLDGTDSHSPFGWGRGRAADVARLAAAVPRLARFVSELGSQVAPDAPPWNDEAAGGRWPDLDWDALATAHGVELEAVRRHVPPDRFATYGSWAAALAAHQAEVVRTSVEVLRRIKYRPTGGVAVHAFAAAGPGFTHAVLDEQRHARPAWSALRAAYRPVLVVADPLPDELVPGQPLHLDIHAINDRTITIDDMIAVAYLEWISGGGSADGRRTWRWEGTLPADDVALVGTIRTRVPPGATAVDLRLRLTGAHDGTAIDVENRYERALRDGGDGPSSVRT